MLIEVYDFYLGFLCNDDFIGGVCVGLVFSVMIKLMILVIIF